MFIIIIIFFLLMFLTVLKEQSFGSDHFLVLFSMKSIKKRKKKCFKRSLAFLSAVLVRLERRDWR